MSRKLFEIARACFVGGATFCLVALLIAPAFWWAGIVPGFAAGYLAYEFREVQRAIPRALADVSEVFAVVAVEIVEGFREFRSKPHPFGYPALLAGSLLFCAAWYTSLTRHPLHGFAEWTLGLFIGLLFFGVFAAVAGALVYAALMLLAIAGAENWARVYWNRTMSVEVRDRLKKRGLKKDLLTYANAYRWMLYGIFWLMAGLAIMVPRKMWRFCVVFIRIIHSNERLLCGIDGMLGGLIALWTFWQYGPASASLGAVIFVVFCGGLMGAVLGIANWELVSKRVFGFGGHRA